MMASSGSAFMMASSASPATAGATAAEPTGVLSWLTRLARPSASTATAASSIEPAPDPDGGVSATAFGPVVLAPEDGRMFPGDCAVAPAAQDQVAMAVAVHATFLCVGARLGWLDEPPVSSPGSDAFPSRAHQHAAEAVAIAWCESGLDPAARNPISSARGLFQVLRQHDWLFARYGSSWRDGGTDPVLSMAVAADLQAWLVQRGYDAWLDWESANARMSEEVGGPVRVGALPAHPSTRSDSRGLTAPALPSWAADPVGGGPIGGSCGSVWQGRGW